MKRGFYIKISISFLSWINTIHCEIKTFFTGSYIILRTETCSKLPRIYNRVVEKLILDLFSLY